MDSNTAITVKYWIASDQGRKFPDLDGIDDFRRELAADYISVVKGRPAGAGGLTHLYVELISSLSLSYFTRLLLDGVTYDLIKEGSKRFALRPFLAAYRRLRDRNKDKLHPVDIGALQIQYQDSLLVIHEVGDDTIVDNLENILLTLARNYENLSLDDGVHPSEIHVPVFEDPDSERPCRFRVKGFVDETIRANAPDDYFKFWGLDYDLFEFQVYDVQNQTLLNESFNTLERHWAEENRRGELKAREFWAQQSKKSDTSD